MPRRRSPIRVRTRKLAFGIRQQIWTCERPLRGALFEHRKRPGNSAIVVPSTKSPGAFQVTTFDADGPIGDRQYRSCDEALAELSPKHWRLRRVE